MLYPNFHDLIAFKNSKLHLNSSKMRHVNNNSAGGSHFSSLKGQGLEFDSVREYTYGDGIKNIDWRVTARKGSPHVKVFKHEKERHVCVCVDVNETMRFGTRNTFKSVQAAHIAAMIGWKTLALRDKVSVCLFGSVTEGINFFDARKTKKSFLTVLKALSDPCDDRYAMPMNVALQHIEEVMHKGSLMYLISDFIDLNTNKEISEKIRRLSRHCNIVLIAVNDNADAHLIPIGDVVFCGNANGERCVINTNIAAGREAYTNQWEENRKQLRELAAELKLQLIELTTESNILKEFKKINNSPYATKG